MLRDAGDRQAARTTAARELGVAGEGRGGGCRRCAGRAREWRRAHGAGRRPGTWKITKARGGLYAQALAETRGQAAGRPVMAPEQRDLAVALGDLGDVGSTDGDLAAARGRYEEALTILRGQAQAANALARRDVAMATLKTAKTISQLERLGRGATTPGGGGRHSAHGHGC